MKPIVLAILDGIGLNDKQEGNAFLKANTPHLDRLMDQYPYSRLNASGPDVGLPIGQMGNSEVGHLNIGAGRVVFQALEQINTSIENGTFYTNSIFKETIDHVITYNSKIHIIGLLSDGGVHSHIDHLIALLKLLKIKSIKKVYLHLILDGRDTDPKAALTYLDKIEKVLDELKIGTIASISGRYFMMDRDKRWDRLEKAYNIIVKGEGDHNNDPRLVIEQSYEKNVSDEFIHPTLIDTEGLITDNDAVIISNFRPDRIIEIGTALSNPNFDGFSPKVLNNLKLTTLFPTSTTVLGKSAFQPDEFKNTLGMYLNNLGLKQLRIAETEKYAHVTYFFDGGKELILDNCQRIMIPSSKIATYDLEPEMQAGKITERLISEINNNYDLIVVNYANGDMVGHTGNFEAAVKAVEEVDRCIGQLYEKVQELGGLLILTADHGNCEEMIDENNQPITSHSLNKVPFIVCNSKYIVKDGKLADIAPTILTIMEMPIPQEMKGKILVEVKNGNI